MTIKLGIAPINWCNDDDPSLGKDISFEQCINEMSEAGYVGTEMGNKFPRDTRLLKQSLENRGLEMASAWFSSRFTEPAQYDATLSAFLDHLTFMRAMGARFINVCECGHSIQNTLLSVSGSKRPQFSTDQWDKLIQGLHAIGRLAHDYHIQIVYHYHAGTGVFTQQEINYLMHHTSPELISLLLDTGHAAFAGIDPVTLIREHKKRIRYVHLKDIRQNVLNTVIRDEYNFMDAVRAGVFTVPGDGNMDFTAVLEELRKNDYQGWMIVEAEQDPAKAPPLQYARKAFTHINEIMQNVAKEVYA